VLVGLLWGLDTSLTGLISQSMYFYLVTMFNDINQPIIFTKSLTTEHLLTALCVLCVQLFYVGRIWSLSNKAKIISISAIISSLAAFACGIAYITRIFENRHLETFYNKEVRIFFGLSSGFNVLSDIVITGSLLFWLTGHRQENGRTVPQSLFDTVVINFINRGVLLSIVQVALFVTFVTNSAILGWIPIQLILSKVYINSLLGLLNYRPVVHGRGLREEEASGLSTTVTSELDTPDDFAGVHISLERSTESTESPLKEAVDAIREFKNELMNL